MSQLAAGTAGSNGFCKIFMLHAKKLVIDLAQTWRILVLGYFFQYTVQVSTCAVVTSPVSYAEKRTRSALQE